MQLDVAMDKFGQLSNAVLQCHQLFEPVIEYSQKVVLSLLLIDSMNLLSVFFKHLIQECEIGNVNFIDPDAPIAFEDVVGIFCPALIVFGDQIRFKLVKWAARVVDVLWSEGDVASFGFFGSILAIVFHLGC